ncbi:MAG: hypothetical protein C4324_11655 [Blastocatellia bacterium]
MNSKRKTFVALALCALLIGITAINATAQQIQCSGPAGEVTAMTNPAGHTIATKFQLDSPNLQPLLQVTIRTKRGCLVAHLGGLARITDNYVVFQVRVDGVPMKAHAFIQGFSTPVLFCLLDANSEFQDEQFIDPIKVVSYNFFNRVSDGEHTVEVLAPAGSSIIPENPPTVQALVLTLEYR